VIHRDLEKRLTRSIELEPQELELSMHPPKKKIKHGRPLGSLEYSVDVRLSMLTQALANGENSIEELCELVHHSPPRLRRFCEEHDIDLPQDLIPYKYRPEIDRLIDEGRRLQEIGTAVELTGEAVRLYIGASGQHTLWEEAKKRRKTAEDSTSNKKSNLEHLDILLRQRLRQQAKTEGWAYEKAVDYFNARKIRESSRSISLFVLVDALKRYESAQEWGERRSLENLAEGLPLTYAHFGRVLNQLGLKPLHRGHNRKKKEKYEEKQLAILRASELDMGDPDLAYFLDVSPLFVTIRRGDGTVKKIGRTLLGQVGYERLTYRLASQIYEAQDAGFTSDEIPELLDASVTVVSFVLKERSTFEPKILDGLRVLYDKPELDKPYRIKE